MVYNPYRKYGTMMMGEGSDPRASMDNRVRLPEKLVEKR